MDTIRRPKDLLTGILFAVIGAGVMVIAHGYKFGTPRQMGPGFFPIVLAAILLCLAAILIVRSLLGDREMMSRFALRPALYVLGSAVLFSLLLRPAGLMVAIVVMVTLVSQAKGTLTLGKSFVLGLLLAAGSALLFAYLLDQHIPLLGNWFGA